MNNDIKIDSLNLNFEKFNAELC